MNEKDMKLIKKAIKEEGFIIISERIIDGDTFLYLKKKRNKS